MQPLSNPHRSTTYIFVLTLILGALQLAWSTEFSEATPFLLSLNMSKMVLSLVWLAGPLSGVIGQPIVGLLSDRCMFKYGRRRIFITSGCVATVISLLLLAHSKPIMVFLTAPLNLAKGTVNVMVISFACLGIYVLDFSIQVIQASSRALIVDVVPTDQQQLANAWAARMVGIFNLIGFWLGSLNLTKLFPIFGDTQFKVLSVLVTIIMVSLVTLSCLLIKERNPNNDITLITQRNSARQKLIDAGINPDEQSMKKQLVNFFKEIWNSFQSVPEQVKLVCYAQLFAWIGYFPLLFYTTSYVGELYLYEKGYANPKLIPENIKQELLDEATRVGTYALLSNSIVTLLIVIILPELIEKFKKSSTFNLKNLWILSHIIFIACTLSTFFVSTSGQAISLFAFTGIPWGCAVWIPFSLISEEISRIKDIVAVQIHYKQSTEEPSGLSISFKDEVYTNPTLIAYYERVEYDSGILLALHNVFVSAPQIISSLISSVLFSFFRQTAESGQYDSSLAWIFRFGGVMCFGALYISTKIRTADQLYEIDTLMVASEEF